MIGTIAALPVHVINHRWNKMENVTKFVMTKW